MQEDFTIRKNLETNKRSVLVLLIAFVSVGKLLTLFYDQRNLFLLFQPQFSTVIVPTINLPTETIQKVLCIDDKAYGQTFNMILTIAAARTVAFELTQSLNAIDSNNSTSSTITSKELAQTVAVNVGLGPFFSDFFNATLEPKDDVLLYYIPRGSIKNETECHYYYEAEFLFRKNAEMNWNVDSRVLFLQSLIPKPSIRQQAMSYLQKLQSPSTIQNANDVAIITTVHRRNFEGHCHRFIPNRAKVICMDPQTWNRKSSLDFFTDDDLLNFCNLNYNMIQKDLKNNNNDGVNNTILLCSDRQAPKYDKTFPHLVTITPEIPSENKIIHKAIIIVTEAWIMTLSDIHYGNPMSTVDAVVNIWRNNPLNIIHEQQQQEAYYHHHHPREMRPVTCYGSK